MATVTHEIAATVDDQYVDRSEGAYPLVNDTNTWFLSSGLVAATKTLSAGTYTGRVILLRFDTSAIPDDANMHSAVLRVTTQDTILNADARNAAGDYYQWDGVSESDYTDNPGSGAFSKALSTFPSPGTAVDIPLDNLSRISRTGTTYLRIGIDGGAPTGQNYLPLVDVTSVSVAQRPKLIVSYNLAVGATLSGITFPLRHAGLGPYLNSAGNVYFFGRDGTNTGTVEPHKAADPMTSFTAQTAKLMSSGTTTAIEAMATFPDRSAPDLIHVMTQIATGATYYNSYNMSTDAWTLTTSETAAAAASFAPSSNTAFVTPVVRSNGNVVFGYNAGLTAMSSGFNMCRYRERTGTNTYGTAVNVDNGGSVNWLTPVAVLGAGDRVHFFFSDATNGRLYQRTLTAANALQTFPAQYGTTATGVHVHKGGLSYASGANTQVVAAVYKVLPSVNNAPHVAYLTSSDAPTPTLVAVSDENLAFSQQPVQDVAVEGTTLHSVYARGSDQDVYHDSSADGGATWGADTNEYAGATMNRITVNVYERPAGDKKLAMVLDDGGTIKYAELNLPEQGFPFETNPIFRHVLSLR